MNEQVENPGEQLLTYQEAAKLLGMKVSTLYSLVFHRKVPHIRLTGKMVRFSDQELSAWVQASRVEPAPAKVKAGRKK